MPTPTETLIADLKHATILNSIMGILDWDQQVNLPPDSSGWRGLQMEAISPLCHKASTLPRIGKNLDALDAKADSATPEEKVLRKCARKDYERLTKLPARFIAKKALLDSQSFQAWVAAKKTGNFKTFAPFLEKELAFTKKRAALICAPNAYDELITFKQFFKIRAKFMHGCHP